MIRSLKTINFIPGTEAIQVLQTRPVSLDAFLKSLEQSYRPGSQLVTHANNTNFVEAMMAPVAPSRPAIHRKYAKSQIDLMLNAETELHCNKRAGRRSHPPNNNGDIISWNHVGLLGSRKPHSRCYSNRSSIISNGSLQSRMMEKLPGRRHYDDETRQFMFQQQCLKKQLSKSKPDRPDQEMSGEDKSVYKIVLDPTYQAARPPYGTDQDEIESLAKISTSYHLHAPFDTGDKIY
jgi:hypothetical protein